MQKILFILAPLLLALPLLAQTPPVSTNKFAGEYIGIATPAKWSTNADERVIVDLFVYPDGRADINFYDYDFETLVSASGRIDRTGLYTMTTEGTGYLVRGRVTGGTARGSVIGPTTKYTWAALRRHQRAYDP